MQDPQRKTQPTHTIIYALIVIIIAAFVYSRFGFDGFLFRDDAAYAYSGQQLAKGIPPYISIFDAKTPMGPLIAGVGAAASSYMNVDSLLGIRLAYFFVGCSVVLALLLLARKLFNSYRIGFLTAFTFLGFWGFGRHVASGPRPKIPFVLFEVLVFWMAARRSWFWAGSAAAMAFLTWQPGAFLVLVILVVAFLQPGEGQNRWRSLILASAGIVTPLLLVVLYFSSQNSLNEFFEAAFLHPLLYVQREKIGFVDKLLLPIDQVQQGYNADGNIALFGVAMVIVLFAWRIQTFRKFRQFIANDHFAAFLISFPLYIIWSLYDFQGYPDFYVLLPYAAIGFAWFIYLALKGMEAVPVGTPLIRNLTFILICFTLAASAARSYAATNDSERLLTQREWANKIETKFLSPDNNILLTFGKPEALVLLERQNPNRHVLIIAGEDKFIEKNTGLSLDEWWRQQMCIDPPVVVMGPVRPFEIRGKFTTWLAEAGFEESNIGNWNIFVAPEGGFDCG